jgi:hypothetical protein
MTISLADAFTQIQAAPLAPVILLDTCSLLDLFRTDESQTKVPYQPRAPHEVIRLEHQVFHSAVANTLAAHAVAPRTTSRSARSRSAPGSVRNAVAIK